ncbi:hypothetical protein Rhopal_004576-T1 [Rhodotorula paludigena]|uniref:Proteophosphoglycan ppg4 n=1 Tax=Rhodotorula paludigena TaxID=86838 RepID=A0AAV5GSA9_9BASI|nr:hypothetical protein Rhopal_004576-T1 [Rhodotorula paludigena]
MAGSLDDWSDTGALSSYLATQTDVTATAALPALTSAFASALAGNQDAARDALEDPLLDALPAFTYAMPMQVVVLGVTVTLLSMLLVHLLFTIRYHAPLNRTNYALQTMATGLSLANLAAQLHIVMNNLYRDGRVWPFMFDYIEVSFPKKSWSQPQRAAWLLLQGLNALATHSTHIQFLTMLFPSALEARLILGLLGPLAVATAGLVFTSLAASPAVNDLGDAIRNTANSSLTLLYTMALFIWGLTLNRQRAWRTEGGTASFGGLALALGLLGTAVNFVEIREERMRWLPGVVTCILLWQSWVGFWWWVGAGMWTGEAEDVERRREKKKRKEERRRRKREAAAAAASTAQGEGAEGEGTGARSAVGSLRRRFTRTNTASAGEVIELQDMQRSSAAAPSPAADDAGAGGGENSRSDSNSSTVSSSRPSSHHFYDPLVNLFVPFLTRLRTAHDAAAIAQAAKPPGLPEDVRRGWGIRALMMRGKKERGERRQAARGRVRSGAEMDAAERRAGFELDGGARLEEEERDDVGEGGAGGTGAEGARRGGDEDEWEDAGTLSSDESSDLTSSAASRRAGGRRRVVGTAPNGAAAAPVDLQTYPPRLAGAGTRETGDEPAQNWAGRADGADEQGSWSWRGMWARWRVRDVSQW